MGTPRARLTSAPNTLRSRRWRVPPAPSRGADLPHSGPLPWTAVLPVPTGLFPGRPWAFPGFAPFSSSSPDTFLGQEKTTGFAPVPLLRADSGHHLGDSGKAPGAGRLCCPHGVAPPAFGSITLLSDHPTLSTQDQSPTGSLLMVPNPHRCPRRMDHP